MLTKIKSVFARFAKDESGAALLEYSLLIAVITAGAVGLVLGGADWVVAQWTDLQADLGAGANAFPPADGTGG